MTGSVNFRSANLLLGRALRLLAGPCLALVCLAGAASGQALQASLERDSIFEGESTILQIRVSNADDARLPTIEVPDCDVETLGQSTSTQVINFRASSSVTHNYRITPRRTGKIEIPAFEVETASKTLRSRSLVLRVVEPTAQDHVFAVLTAEPESLYPLQQFTVQLRVFVHALPDPHEHVDPLEPLSGNPPGLSIPWAEVPEGLESNELSAWLSPLQAQRRSRRQSVSGFTINDIQARQSLFSIGFDNNAAIFDLKGRAATEEDFAADHPHRSEASRYWVYTLTRRYTARIVGSYQFGVVRVKGTFADLHLSGGQLQGKEIYTLSNPLHVVVKDAPLEGRPESFTGAFGVFQSKAEANPTQLRVGDPLTLTLSITGRGNLAEIAAPDLDTVPGFADHFRLYEPTSETRDRRRLFTWSLRPSHEDVQQIPAIPFTAFDVDKERYVTIHSDPLDIEVEAATRLDTSDIVAGRQPDAGEDSLTAHSEGLFANIADAREIRDERVPLRSLGGYLASLPVVYLLAALVVPRWRNRRLDPSRARRRGAIARSRQLLQDGVARGRNGERSDAAGLCRSSFASLVADAACVPAAGLTTRDITRHLDPLGVGEDLLTGVAEVLDGWEELQYGAGPEDLTSLSMRSEQVLEELARALRKKGALS